MRRQRRRRKVMDRLWEDGERGAKRVEAEGTGERDG
jgi:hypothetical protein